MNPEFPPLNHASLKPPDRPPDGSGGSAKVSQPRPSSFRDKLLGGKVVPPPGPRVDLLAEKLVRIEFEKDNPLLPKVLVADSVVNKFRVPWDDALIVKLMGKNLGYALMKSKLNSLWKPTCDMDMMDLGHGFYMVKLDDENDRVKAIEGGPWMIFYHCLAVRRWTPESHPEYTKIDKTLVWVRFPGLNLLWYDESFLMAMAAAVGTPVKVDRNTLGVVRGRFARVCVEIELHKPVRGKFWINGLWQKVEYEGLHYICSLCGCYGHLSSDCHLQPASDMRNPEKVAMPGGETGKPNQEAEKIKETNKDKSMVPGIDLDENPHGDWMVVARNRKVPQLKRRKDNKHTGAATKNQPQSSAQVKENRDSRNGISTNTGVHGSSRNLRKENVTKKKGNSDWVGQKGNDLIDNILRQFVTDEEGLNSANIESKVLDNKAANENHISTDQEIMDGQVVIKRPRNISPIDNQKGKPNNKFRKFFTGTKSGSFDPSMISEEEKIARDLGQLKMAARRKGWQEAQHRLVAQDINFSQEGNLVQSEPNTTFKSVLPIQPVSGCRLLFLDEPIKKPPDPACAMQRDISGTSGESGPSLPNGVNDLVAGQTSMGEDSASMLVKNTQ